MNPIEPFSTPMNRRAVLAIAAGSATALFAPRIARAMTEVSFTEAVHNLGYINLYVGQAAGYFEK